MWELNRATLLTINDNNGALFPMYQHADRSVVVPVLGNEPPDMPKITEAAIGEVRVTDAALLLGRGLSLATEVVLTNRNQCPAGQAALLSFAEALRRGCQAELDIDPSELVVGLQPRAVDGAQTAAVYVADTLENGAGYALELVSGRLEAVLARITEDVGGRWSLPTHSECDTSCPDCLRSWDNRHVHAALDWRLALDVADLARGQELQLDRWLSLGPAAAEEFRRGFQNSLAKLTVLEVDGVLVLRAGHKATAVGHPLWSRDSSRLNPRQSTLRFALGAEGLDVQWTDVRTLRNRPDQVFSMLR